MLQGVLYTNGPRHASLSYSLYAHNSSEIKVEDYSSYVFLANQFICVFLRYLLKQIVTNLYQVKKRLRKAAKDLLFVFSYRNFLLLFHLHALKRILHATSSLI